jgi:hypothetical protein
VTTINEFHEDSAPAGIGLRRVLLVALVMLATLIVTFTVLIIARPVLQQALQVAQAPTTLPQLSPIPRTAIPTVTLKPPTLTPSATLFPSSTPIPTLFPTLLPTLFPTLTPNVTATFTPLPPTAVPVVAAAPNCVSVAGDSAAYGDVVYELAGVGYVNAHLTPISTFIAAQFQQRGQQVSVFNRSVPAVGISSSNHPSYFGTLEYSLLLQDRCPYVVVMPWVNDLTSWRSPGESAPQHAAALSRLAQEIIASNPAVKVLVLNFYQGAPQPYAARSFAEGFTPEAVGTFNAQIAAACNSGGLALPNVQCLDTSAAVAGVSYLAGNVTWQDLSAALASPLSAEEENFMHTFFNNGGAMATGDGVHLSGAGKAAIAAYVVQFMR